MKLGHGLKGGIRDEKRDLENGSVVVRVPSLSGNALPIGERGGIPLLPLQPEQLPLVSCTSIGEN
jgi:hypothetical protein